jgi:hypothetical protein
MRDKKHFDAPRGQVCPRLLEGAFYEQGEQTRYSSRFTFCDNR